jgi:hypothetical protein
LLSAQQGHFLDVLVDELNAGLSEGTADDSVARW